MMKSRVLNNKGDLCKSFPKLHRQIGLYPKYGSVYEMIKRNSTFHSNKENRLVKAYYREFNFPNSFLYSGSHSLGHGESNYMIIEIKQRRKTVKVLKVISV